jgi:Domain of unknown function (DUF4158)
MKGDYPKFKASYSHDGLVEHFHLDTPDQVFVSGIRGDVNREAVAVLLKSLLYLGYFVSLRRRGVGKTIVRLCRRNTFERLAN